MSEYRSLSEMLADIQQSQQVFLDSLSRVDDTRLYKRPSEQEWSMAENLVHISEARQFFASEVLRGLSTPGAKVGRTITDPVRVQNVLDHGSDAREIIAQKLVDSYDLVYHTLTQMRDDDLHRVVEHVKYGPQTLAEFIGHFIVEHDRAHVAQLRAVLS